MRKGILFIALIGLATSFVVNQLPTKGGDAPEIELKSPSGKTIKLSDLRGKMVLIDFWASWCGPCRRENPNVVEAYKKYNDKKFINGKGFEIFSVSLDKDAKKWEEAIKKDGLIWKNHGIDNGSKAAMDYGVRSIPSGFLIDGDGKIVAMGNELRGLGLHMKLDEQLK